MKKKCYLLLLLIIPILLFTTACDKKKEEKKETTKTIQLEDKNLNFKTTFTVDSNSKYSNVEVDTESGSSAVLSFQNNDLDVEFEMYYNRMRKTTYENTKKSRSSKKYYKEYQFGEYNAYAYGDYDDNLYLNIILKEENDDVIVLFVAIDRIDNNKEVIISDVVKEKEIQSLFNSMKFEKTNNE